MLIGYWKYVHTAVQVQSSTGLVLQDRCAGNPQRQYRSVVHHFVMWLTNCIMPPPFIGSRMYVRTLILRLLYAASNLAIYGVRLQRSFIVYQFYG